MQEIVHISTTLPAVDYDILFSPGSLGRAGDILKNTISGKVLVVTDSNVLDLYASVLERSLTGAGIGCNVEVIPAGEESKNLDNAIHLISRMADYRMTRTDAVIALGGGVVGDLAGFAASIYLRGIPFIQIPTTLLSQLDSSVGGKVGVNIPHGKNLVGSFYNPVAVISDPHTLQTLTDRDFNAGMAEAVKYGCIYDEELFATFEEGVYSKSDPEKLSGLVSRCCEIKGEYVKKDPVDKGVRMELNFGHTVGHAIEKQSGYGVYYHGEAVAIGMVASAKWGESLGITASGTSLRIKRVLERYGLPVSVPHEDVRTFSEAFSMDKKNLHNSLKFVYLSRMGKALVKAVSVEELVDWLIKNC